MEIVAHRGASRDAPENTLAAFRLGWEQKADAVELDIRSSRDGKLVVIHDDNTRRVARFKKPVKDQTLAELRLLDAGQWKGRLWAGERIPTLDEALATIPDGGRMFIELKCGPEALGEFKRVVTRCGKPLDQIAAIGFSAEMMAQVKKAVPKLEGYWIASFKRNWKLGRWTPSASQLVETARAAGLDGLDLDARGPVDAALVNKLKEARLKVYVWTVDSAFAARRLVKAGVDGITTNRPGWLRERLRLDAH